MPDVLTVGVCGAGAMGSGIAQVAAQAGAQVWVFDVSEASRTNSEAAVGKSFRQAGERGRISPEDVAQFLAAMRWTGDMADLGDCDLVIEAIVEDLAIKHTLFTQLEDIVRPDAIIASNTSSLPIARLAKQLRYPGRFAGMHFFNPATAMKLVEVVSGPATAPEVTQRIADVASRWKKLPVAVADVPGFIVNRVARSYYAEAFLALQQSAAPAAVIDHLFRGAAGFRMGPLELTDLIGQDVNFAVAQSVYESYFGQTRFTPQLAQAALVDAGWLGRKSGRGVYDYRDGAAGPQALAAEAVLLSGAPTKPDEIDLLNFAFEARGITVRFTRGRTARDEAHEAGGPVALLDWFDGANASAAGFSVSDEAAVAVGAGLLLAWDLQPFRVADRPGMVIARTLAQIANGAGDAVLDGVSDETGIDTALRFGANYPFGPFEWARKVGPAWLTQTLRSIAHDTGRSIYSPSEYWMLRS